MFEEFEQNYFLDNPNSILLNSNNDPFISGYDGVNSSNLEQPELYHQYDDYFELETCSTPPSPTDELVEYRDDSLSSNFHDSIFPSPQHDAFESADQYPQIEAPPVQVIPQQPPQPPPSQPPQFQQPTRAAIVQTPAQIIKHNYRSPIKPRAPPVAIRARPVVIHEAGTVRPMCAPRKRPQPRHIPINVIRETVPVSIRAAMPLHPGKAAICFSSKSAYSKIKSASIAAPLVHVHPDTPIIPIGMDKYVARLSPNEPFMTSDKKVVTTVPIRRKPQFPVRVVSYIKKPIMRTRREKDEYVLRDENFKPFTCEDCGEAFAMYNEVLEHKKIHVRETERMCFFCNTRFPCYDTALAHIVFRDKNDETKEVKFTPEEMTFDVHQELEKVIMTVPKLTDDEKEIEKMLQKPNPMDTQNTGVYLPYKNVRVTCANLTKILYFRGVPSNDLEKAMAAAAIYEPEHPLFGSLSDNLQYPLYSRTEAQARTPAVVKVPTNPYSTQYLQPFANLTNGKTLQLYSVASASSSNRGVVKTYHAVPEALTNVGRESPTSECVNEIMRHIKAKHPN